MTERDEARQQLETIRVSRGDITNSVSATGTVEPVEVVDIGAQIVGQVVELGTDVSGKTIEFGSVVAQGALLLRIDDRLYVADAHQAEANLERSQAELSRAKATRFIAERDWTRAQRVGRSPSLSRSAFDTYHSAYDAATAGVASAEAAVHQAAAALERARLNVNYCTIRSPVKGTVIDKRVNIGQTVVSSFNAPSLFLIAKDLTKIQVWVSVNEADVTSIIPGQGAIFTLDAFPGEEFRGRVNKVRLNASMLQNVVSYIVEVDTENPEGRMLPYLTANVRFQAGTATNVLLAPVAATRFMPGPALYPELSKLPPGGRVLWESTPGGVRPIPVILGISDGNRVAVSGDEIREGVEIIVGEMPAKRDQQSRQGVNPFMPQPFRGKKQ